MLDQADVADESALAHLRECADDVAGPRRTPPHKPAGTVKPPPALVRLIKYRVDGQADIVRLITSLTDHEKYPTEELTVLYSRRWEIELVFDEIKTRQRGRPVLRAQTPDGVRSAACVAARRATSPRGECVAAWHGPLVGTRTPRISVSAGGCHRDGGHGPRDVAPGPSYVR
ncbi:transposase [Streptomyces sp. NBC_01320]|nr:transposase [Streptomyces sp. NBC_01320]